MARVTVEDCVLKVPNRFDLVMLAAQRARDVSAGAPLTIDRDNDKNPVIALREIAEETVNLETLHDTLIQGLQKHVEIDEIEEESVEFDLSGLGADSAETAGPAVEAAEPVGGEALPVDLLDEREELREDGLTVIPEPAAAPEEEGGQDEES